MSKINKNQETLISRIMLMLIGFIALSLLAAVYVMPFSKSHLVINNYYHIIEYVVMALMLGFLVLSIVYNKKSQKERLITPPMCIILSAFAFAASVIIPFSGSRVRFLKVSVIIFAFAFVSYTVYYLVNKAFTYQTVICGIYFILIKLFGNYYTANVTFEEKIALTYTSARFIFAILVLVILGITALVYKKHPRIKLWHTAMLSAVPLAMLVARSFVYDYVILCSLLLLVVVFVALLIATKLQKKHK